MSSRRSRKRRQEQRQNIQPVVKVLAELALGHCVFQDGVSGGDDAHVHLYRLRAAQPQKVAFFQHAQQLGLKTGRSVANLVEKQRPLRGFLNQAFLSPARIGEGPRLVAEEFAFQQCVRQGGAIDADERRLRARAVVVDGLGQHFLSGAALALNEHGGVVAFGRAASHLQHVAA